jgi:hypothetical protein
MNPFELADYLGFAAALFAGTLLGRRMRSPRAATSPELECSCGHGYGTHDLGGGKCHGERRGNPISYDPVFSRADGWEMQPCRCMRYDGPDPLSAGRTFSL